MSNGTEKTLGFTWPLSMESLQLFEPGQKIKSGDCIGYVGLREVNGGWEPHLHFQLSWIKPENCDLPGVVRRDERTDLAMYPDPRMSAKYTR